MLTMYRAIEVFLPKDEENMPMGLHTHFLFPILNLCFIPFFFLNAAVINGTTDMLSRMLHPQTSCYTSSTFYGVILGLGIFFLVIIGFAGAYIQRLKKDKHNPNK